VIAAVAWLERRLGRGPLVAMLIFVGVLVPALGFVTAYPLHYSYVADHFQYLAGPALIALIVALATAVIRQIAPAAKPLPHVLAGVVLGALLVLTLMRSSVFASPIDLWRDAAAKNPASAMVHSNYGQALFAATQQQRDLSDEERAKLFDDAAQQLGVAVKLYPEHDESLDKALTLWGRILLFQGKPAEAIDKFDRAAAADSRNYEALLGRGDALIELKRVDDAIKAYRAALATAEVQRAKVSREAGAAVVQALARALAAHGDRAEAIALYQRAIKAAGERANLHKEYADLLRDIGKKTDAALEYRNAILLDPAYIDARLALGRLMMSVGNLEGAQQQLVAAARINSLYPPLMDAAKEFDALMKVHDASTRAATTRSTSGPATSRPAEVEQALRQLTRPRDATSEVYVAPATQPSSR
jgi:tetratricopeptide (TPR) repeat protein